MIDSLSRQLDYAQFAHGMALILLTGTSRAFGWSRSSPEAWRWLGVWASVRGLLALVAVPVAVVGVPPGLASVRVMLLLLSGLALLEYCRRGPGWPAVVTRRWLAVPVLIVGGAWLGGGTVAAEAAVHYAVGLPACVLGARVFVAMAPGRAGARSPLRLAALGMGLLAVSAELIVDRAAFPPTTFLNVGTVAILIGVPVEIVRAVAALLLGYGVWQHYCDRAHETLQVGGERTWAIYERALASVLVLVLLGGWVATEAMSAVGERRMRLALVSRATTVAAMLPESRVSRLTGSQRDLSTEAYREVREALQEACRVQADVESAAIVGLRGGAFLYLAHATRATAGTGDTGVLPGDPYRQPTDVVADLLLAGPDGGPAEPVRDDGETISAWVKVGGRDGRSVTRALELVLGAEPWRRQVAASRLVPMLFTLLTGAVLVAFFLGERKAAQSGARMADSERQYRGLVEGSPNGIMLLDHGGRCLTINRNGLRVFGVAEARVIGQPLSVLWLPSDRPVVEAIVDRARRGEATTTETRFVRSDGSAITVELALNPVISAGGRVTQIVGIVTDITERRRAQLALDRGHRFTQVILGISARFLGLRTERVDAATREALREVGSFLGVDRAQLFHLSPDRASFSLTHEWCAPGVPSRLAQLQATPLSEYPWIWSTIEHVGVVQVSDTDQLPDAAGLERESLRRQRVGAFLCVAVQRRGAVAGFLALDVFDRRREWPDEELTLLQIVADVLSNALTRKHAEEALRESEQRFQTAFRTNPAAMAIVRCETRRIVEVNEAFLRLVAYEQDAVVGRLFDELDLLVDVEARAAVEAGLAGDSAMRATEVRFRTGAGEIRDASLSLDAFELAGQRYLLTVAIDLSERTRAEEALREREEIFRSISAAAQDAIIMIDPDARVTVWNEAAERMFGYTRAEAEGQPLYALIIPEDYESGFLAGFGQFRMTGEGPFVGAAQQVFARRKDGSLLPVELLASGVRLRERWHAVGIIRDITERLKIDEALWKAKEESEAANSELQRSVERANRLAEEAGVASAAKSEFLANMSHEIRTPMNGIIGMTGLLLDTHLSVDQREYVETVRSCADSLLTIINEILDFSKIEAGRLDLEMLDFDLGTTLEDMIDILAMRADQKNLELACLLASDVPTLLCGDPGRLRQILTNLVGNAIKFTERGEVTLIVSAEEVTPREACLRFTVRDTGIGIPDAKLGTLFQPFTQVDSSTTRRFGGTGLGLSISKRLAEMMGGTIGVESREGVGSSFWVTARFSRQDEATAPGRLPVGEIEGLRILGVDDNATNRRVMAGILDGWGCRHTEVDSAAATLAELRTAALASDPYRIAILDMLMPGVSGDALGRQIKADPLIHETALVMMTSVGRRGEVSRLEEIGFAGYLTKPVKMSQLRALLMTLAGRQRDKPTVPGPIVTRFTLAESARRKRRILLAEDNITNQKVATKLVERLGHRVDAVANGVEAVKALRTMPYDLVLMDVQMPEMDGLEATRCIRTADSGVRNPRIPIIAMTAHAMKGDRQRCLDAGMDDYVSKPIDPEELAAAIARWTNSDLPDFDTPVVAAPSAPPPVSPAPLPPQAPAPVDREVLLGRLGGDLDVFHEVVEIFLADVPRQLEAMGKALAQGDTASLRRLAHSLKGSSGTAGAAELQQVAYELEQTAADGDLEAAPAQLQRVVDAFEPVRHTMETWVLHR